MHMQFFRNLFRNKNNTLTILLAAAFQASIYPVSRQLKHKYLSITILQQMPVRTAFVRNAH